MAYSLCFVLQTLDFMDAAGSWKILSWAQDSWKQICFNKLWITGRATHTHLHTFRCMSKKLLFKSKSYAKFHLVTYHSFDFKSCLSDLLLLLALLSHSPAFGLELGSFKHVAAKKNVRIYTRRWTSGKIEEEEFQGVVERNSKPMEIALKLN